MRLSSEIERRRPLVLGLAALLVSAAGPTFAQTTTATTTATSSSAAAAAPAPGPEPEAAPSPGTSEASAGAQEIPRSPAPPAKAAKADQRAEARGDAAVAKAGKDDQVKNVLVRNIADAPVGRRPWFVSGTLSFRTNVVSDEDPANDMGLRWSAQAGHAVSERASVFAQLALDQAFVAEEGESGLRLSDVQAGVNYIHRVDLKGLGLDRKISFFHRAAVFLPTSRQSQNQDLIVAPRLLSRGRVQVVGDLYFGFTGLLSYRWHEFAERIRGPGLTRFAAASQFALEYTALQSETWGTVVLGVDTYGGWNVRYRAQPEVPDGFLGPAVVGIRDDTEDSNPQLVAPFYGFDLYALWVPFPSLSAGLVYTQGEPLFQDGVPRVQIFDREVSQLSLSITGRY